MRTVDLLAFHKSQRTPMTSLPEARSTTNQPEGCQAMIDYRTQAVWELCRQGYPMSADEAEKRWSEGNAYHPDAHMQVPRTLRALIDRCNYEASAGATEGGAVTAGAASRLSPSFARS
jgi:hypothetical protein